LCDLLCALCTAQDCTPQDLERLKKHIQEQHEWEFFWTVTWQSIPDLEAYVEAP